MAVIRFIRENCEGQEQGARCKVQGVRSKVQGERNKVQGCKDYGARGQGIFIKLCL